MDYHGIVRIGTNLPDKRVFMNLRRMVADIQAQNGGQPITDADRLAIATELKVKVETVKRMEPRIFANDIAVAHTDHVPDEDEDRIVITVDGGHADVECAIDQREILARIQAIVESNFETRDVEIICARLEGDMTPEKYDALVATHGLSIESIRQIQRSALMTIRETLQRGGIAGMGSISV